MPLISVTRLHLRSKRYLLGFLWHTLASARQAQRAPGFLGGVLAGDRALGSWTVTAWADAAVMRAYRNSGAHLRAMPKLLRWADEAAFVHWEQDSPRLPSMAEAHRRLVAEGRLSKVNHPSPAHAARQVAAELPRIGRHLRPAAR
jgi:heme-degrading monooxygenase HmoA